MNNIIKEKIYNPLVTVVIANYNSELYIVDTLKSLKNQQYRNIEIIIIDDCSTDNSVTVIEDFLLKNNLKENVIFIKQNVNIGGGKAKKLGLDNANGEIIGFLDCDDYLTENSILKMVECHCKFPDVGLIYSNAYSVNKDGNILGLLNKSKLISPEQTILETCTVFHFVTWKKTYYEMCKIGFSDKFNIAYDLDLFFKLEEVSKIMFINEPLYYYRIHGGNLSIGFDKMGISMVELTIAKYEAQCRRNKLEINLLGSELQYVFNQNIYQKRELKIFRFNLLSIIKRVLNKKL
jgi:glycosyltransferase involved in cell wall biosynthesis